MREEHTDLTSYAYRSGYLEATLRGARDVMWRAEGLLVGMRGHRSQQRVASVLTLLRQSIADIDQTSQKIEAADRALAAGRGCVAEGTSSAQGVSA